MIGIELRDEEYDELISYAKEIVKEAHEIKDKSCMLIKRLALIDDEEYDYEDEEDDEPNYRGVAYRKHNRSKSYFRRMK